MAKIRVFVIANCQAPVIARSLELLNPSIVAKHLVVFQAERPKADHYRKIMSNSDFVFHFSIRQGFPFTALETDQIQNLIGDRSRTITNLFFHGLHPDFSYVGQMNKRLKGPFGDYHSKLVIGGYKLGLSISETAALISDATVQEKLGYRSAFRDSIDELKHRDQSLDIRFAEVLEPMLTGRALPFYTFNHPTPWVIQEFGRHILNSVGLDADPLPHEVLPPWLRNGAMLPIYDTVAAWNGIPDHLTRWKQPASADWLSHEEAVQTHFDAYADLPPEALGFKGDETYLDTLQSALT